jgi:hypothetical protein
VPLIGRIPAVKKVTPFIVLAALLVFSIFGSLARADEAYSPSCGKNVDKFAHALSLTHTNSGGAIYWEAVWNQNCGYGGTVEWEIQDSTDGGSHWIDDVDNLATTNAGDANITIPESRTTNAFSCSNAVAYRLHIWQYGGTSQDTTVPMSGSCTQ